MQAAFKVNGLLSHAIRGFAKASFLAICFMLLVWGKVL
jgi:hypothetical protein